MSCAAQPNLRLRLLVVGSLWAPRPSWVDPRLVSYRAGLQVAPRKHTMGHAYNPVGLLARLSQLCLALHTLHTQRVCVIFWGGYGFLSVGRALAWVAPAPRQGYVVLSTGTHPLRGNKLRYRQIWIALAPTTNAVTYAGVPTRAAVLALFAATTAAPGL